MHSKHTKNRSAFALRFRGEVLAIKKFTYAQLFYKESYTVERNKGQAAELYATAKQKGAAEDVAVFQAKYDKAMTQAGYVRYGVKDATGTLALAAIAGIPALRPKPFDEETNQPHELRALFDCLTARYGTPELIRGKLGSPQDVKTEKISSGKEIFIRLIYGFSPTSRAAEIFQGLCKNKGERASSFVLFSKSLARLAFRTVSPRGKHKCKQISFL